VHIYDVNSPARFAVPVGAEVDEYRAVRAHLGLSRTVVVQPRPYWTDNSVLLRTVAELGLHSARGVGVIHPDISDSELHALHEGGVRGVRFSLFTPENAVVTFDMIEPVARRIHIMGWHLQLHLTADQIAEHMTLISRLPTPLVFDHMARLPAGGLKHPTFDFVRSLAADGRAWVKLSAPYLNSRAGLSALYDDVGAIAKAFVAAVPDRLVWGSDWPHTSEKHARPADDDLLRLLDDWTGDPITSAIILVGNAATLYGF
jgi:predicted TIM-barrel fold metal-dependent hydrolase